MILKNKSYSELSLGLAEKGITLNEPNLRLKISKGEMPADLFIAIIEALGVESNTVRSIIQDTEGNG